MALEVVIILVCAIVLAGLAAASIPNETGINKWITVWLLVAWLAIIGMLFFI